MKIRTNISLWVVLFCLALVQQAGGHGNHPDRVAHQ